MGRKIITPSGLTEVQNLKSGDTVWSSWDWTKVISTTPSKNSVLKLKCDNGFCTNYVSGSLIQRVLNYSPIKGSKASIKKASFPTFFEGVVNLELPTITRRDLGFVLGFAIVEDGYLKYQLNIFESEVRERFENSIKNLQLISKRLDIDTDSRYYTIKNDLLTGLSESDVYELASRSKEFLLGYLEGKLVNIRFTRKYIKLDIPEILLDLLSNIGIYGFYSNGLNLDKRNFYNLFFQTDFYSNKVRDNVSNLWKYDDSRLLKVNKITELGNLDTINVHTESGSISYDGLIYLNGELPIL